MKGNKGITLIALIVTIIVIIILAGISVNLLLGQNGLLQRAKDAAAQQERAELVEEMKLAIANKQIETKGVLTQADIEEVLGEYGTVADGKVTTTKGGHEIAITDVYNGTITPPVVTAEWEIDSNSTVSTLSLGALVKPKNASLANEKFYVIGIGTGADPVITLLAEKCVKTSSGTGQYTQMDNAGLLAFDSSSNVYYTDSEHYSSICGEVKKYVKKFTDAGMHLQEVTNEAGTSTITGLYGRLMWGTVESYDWDDDDKWIYESGTGELNDLMTNTSITNRTDIVYGPTGAKLNYWLGSPFAGNSFGAWYVYGSDDCVSYGIVDDVGNCRSSSSYRSLTV